MRTTDLFNRHGESDRRATPTVVDLTSTADMASEASITDRNIRIGTHVLSVAELLLGCIDDDAARALLPELPAQERSRLRRRFIDGGLRAVAAADPERRWSQLNVALTDPTAAPGLIAQLSREAQLLHDAQRIDNYSYLHKPPGLRFRYQLHDPDDDLAQEFAHQLPHHAFVGSVTHSVYEPETHLFGGPVSMSHVHQLFTIDSFLWAQHFADLIDSNDHTADPSAVHSDALRTRARATTAALTGWQTSALLLRPLFHGLGIVDLEDLDVWDRIRTSMGRSAPPEVRASDEFQATAADLRNDWQRTRPDRIDPDSHFGRALPGYIHRAQQIAASWRRDYFETLDAYVGPREVMAWTTIFHWNRGGMSSGMQSILAEALADRGAWS